MARAILERCMQLETSGCAPAEAERIAFEEAVQRHGSVPPGLYEAFIAPRQRRSYGVYFTPFAVVDAQVRMLSEALARMHSSFADPRVLVVDPASGAGTYPLAVIGRGGDRRRMVLFETLPGPAVIARSHGLDVRQQDALDVTSLPAADLIVCIGNPPYRRRGTDPRTRALLRPFAHSGVHAKNLHNDYVCFWAWALDRVFVQRSGPGIVSLVTASSYLRGPAFGGVREALRRSCDELWIVDLEGDQLAARRTRNVFPIRTPVAIAMAVRFGAQVRSAGPRVWYQRVGGDRDTKLAALHRVSLDEYAWISLSGGRSASFIPQPRTAYATWPRLTELFPWQVSGVQMKRTWPIAPEPEVLGARWAALLRFDTREAAFVTTRDRTIHSTPYGMTPLAELATDAAAPAIVRYAYRSFDRQWLLADARLGDYLRPSLWRAAGPQQIYLTSLLTNVLGPGPAAVATALVPDMDHFRGSFGARAVIPLWRDFGVPNVAPGVLETLETTPQQLLAYCYAVLGTRGYVRRFEEELRTPGPRIPITRDAGLFRRTAALGQELLDRHTFARVTSGDASEITPISEMPRAFSYGDYTLRVGDGAIAPVAPAVWEYSVSGMTVVRSWLKRRIAPRSGRSPLDRITLAQWSPTLTRELLELVWLLEETIRLERKLDETLDVVVSACGVRLELGSG